MPADIGKFDDRPTHGEGVTFTHKRPDLPGEASRTFKGRIEGGQQVWDIQVPESTAGGLGSGYTVVQRGRVKRIGIHTIFNSMYTNSVEAGNDKSMDAIWFPDYVWQSGDIITQRYFHGQTQTASTPGYWTPFAVLPEKGPYSETSFSPPNTNPDYVYGGAANVGNGLFTSPEYDLPSGNQHNSYARFTDIEVLRPNSGGSGGSGGAALGSVGAIVQLSGASTFNPAGARNWDYRYILDIDPDTIELTAEAQEHLDGRFTNTSSGWSAPRKEQARTKFYIDSKSGSNDSAILSFKCNLGTFTAFCVNEGWAASNETRPTVPGTQNVHLWNPTGGTPKTVLYICTETISTGGSGGSSTGAGEFLGRVDYGDTGNNAFGGNTYINNIGASLPIPSELILPTSNVLQVTAKIFKNLTNNTYVIEGVRWVSHTGPGIVLRDSYYYTTMSLILAPQTEMNVSGLWFIGSDANVSNCPRAGAQSWYIYKDGGKEHSIDYMKAFYGEMGFNPSGNPDPDWASAGNGEGTKQPGYYLEGTAI